MRVQQVCRTLEEYLEHFELPLKVLQQEYAVECVTFELVEDLVKEGISYAEIRLAPQLSLERGLTQEQVVKAAIRGARRGMANYPQIQIGLILCCMRGGTNEELNLGTIETAREYMGNIVCGVSLTGAEDRYETARFRSVFDRARFYQLPVTIDAGEYAGSENIRVALSFGARRIGHGIAAIRDGELLKELILRGVTLEICVTDNIDLHLVGCPEMHPIRWLFDASVKVTMNSGNRTVSSTTLSDEISMLQDRLFFSVAEIDQILKNAWDARFVK